MPTLTLGDQDEDDLFNNPLELAPQPSYAEQKNIVSGPTRIDFFQSHDVPEVG